MRSAVVLMVVVLLIGSCSRNEGPLLQRVKENLASGDTVSAERLLESEISLLPDSKERDSSYAILFSLLKKRSDNLYNKWIESKPKPQDLPRGSVRIVIGVNIDSDDYRDIQERIKGVAEEYLSKTPVGGQGDVARRLLFSVYSQDADERAQQFSRTLLQSTDQEVFRSSRYYLARIAHATGQYSEAISYYEQLANSPLTHNDRPKYLLFMADCFYSLGDIDRALSLLDSVEVSEQDLGSELFTENYVPVWRNAYKSPATGMKHPFIYFEFK